MLFSKATALALHNLRVHRYLPYTFPGGRIYLDVAESRMMLARAMGRYEVRKRMALEQFLKNGDTFVDAGANKGDFALIAARYVGPTGRVLAFEPEPTNFQWITRSIELNGYRQVKPFCVALDDRDGTASLHLAQMSGWHSLMAAPSGSSHGCLTVPTQKLDSVLEDELGNGRVDVLKVDVEGAEMNVLRRRREGSGTKARTDRADRYSPRTRRRFRTGLRLPASEGVLPLQGSTAVHDRSGRFLDSQIAGRSPRGRLKLLRYPGRGRRARASR